MTRKVTPHTSTKTLSKGGKTLTAVGIHEKGAPPALVQPNSDPGLAMKEQECVDTWRAQRNELVLPKFKEDEKKIVMSTREDDLTNAAIAKATGVPDSDLAHRALDQVARVMASYSGETKADKMNLALAALTGLAPQDALEGMLAAQMVAAHNLAMTFASRATNSGDPNTITQNVERATKMMRTFTAQIEALGRYRGKGQQKVTVEHVTVNAGGQAVVGITNASPSKAKSNSRPELASAPVALSRTQEQGNLIQ